MRSRLIYTSKESETPHILGFLNLIVRAEEPKINSRSGSCRRNREINKEGLRKLVLGMGNLQVMREVGTSDFLPSPSLFSPSIQAQPCTEKWELGRQAGVLFSGNIRAATAIPMRKQASVSISFALGLLGISCLRLT